MIYSVFKFCHWRTSNFFIKNGDSLYKELGMIPFTDDAGYVWHASCVFGDSFGGRLMNRNLMLLPMLLLMLLLIYSFCFVLPLLHSWLLLHDFFFVLHYLLLSQDFFVVRLGYLMVLFFFLLL